METTNARAGTLVVLGLARSGVAAATVAVREGWTVLVADDKPDAAADVPAGASRIDVAAAVERVSKADLLIPSPGVPASHPVIEAARTSGVRIAPEIEFAADRLSGTLVAVTGTNGKSTTVSLVGAIFEAAGRRTFTGGNLGDPLCNAVGAVAHSGGPGGPFEFIVAEVSSFQLEHATTFHPHVAAMLNLTPDHLDRHGSMDDYLAAKLRLFQCMTEGDHVVLPRESDWTAKAAASTRASVTYFDPGEARDRQIGSPGYRVQLPDTGWPELPHDLENAAAAVEIARVAGIERAAVEHAIAGFRPLRHRLAKVAEIGGVAWWNDSKATNVGAAASSLRAFDGRVILLAGGISKGCDFGALANEARRITLVVAYGQAGPEIQTTLAPAVSVVREPGLHAAILRAAREARPGDIVLLAPACSSFDEFRDYADRGQSFERWVGELAPDR